MISRFDAKPKRIKLQRKKGWRLPPNSANVARPTKWGNPFVVGGDHNPLDRSPIDAEGAVGMFEDMLDDPEMCEIANYPQDFSELRGKDLACWCEIGEPCHADVLIERANNDT